MLSDVPEAHRGDHNLHVRISNAIRPILLHYMDNTLDSTDYDRRKTYYHKFCNASFCKFMQSKDPENYKPETNGKPAHEDLFLPHAGFGTDDAMNMVIKPFEKF